MADPRTLARVRMFGWRNYQPAPYYAANPPHPPVILGPAVINASSYLLDGLGDYLTDAAGNRLTV